MPVLDQAKVSALVPKAAANTTIDLRLSGKAIHMRKLRRGTIYLAKQASSHSVRKAVPGSCIPVTKKSRQYVSL